MMRLAPHNVRGLAEWMSEFKHPRITVVQPDATIRDVSTDAIHLMLDYAGHYPQHAEFRKWEKILEPGGRTPEQVRRAFFDAIEDGYPFSIDQDGWQTNENARLFVVRFPQVLRWIDEVACRLSSCAVRFCRTPEDFIPLCDVLLKNERLTDLKFMSEAVLDNEMVTMLAKIMPHLDKLWTIMVRNTPSATNFDQLIRAKSNMRRLELWEYEPDDEALIRIAGALRTNVKLLTLTFMKTWKGDDGMREIVHALKGHGSNQTLQGIHIVKQRQIRRTSEVEHELEALFTTR